MFSIRKIGAIARTYQHLERYRQILQVLVKYGFGDLVQSLKIERYVDVGLKMFSQKRDAKVANSNRPERVRMALEELGPTFVKLGQILSTRPDLIPLAMAEELAKLQDNVPPFEFTKAKELIEHELGRPAEEVFADLCEKPIAAASIGQVHSATLIDGGAKVVIKVQRPDIRKRIEVDLEIMMHLAELMENHVEELRSHRPTRVIEEFTRVLGREIDYMVEAGNILRFAHQFEDDMGVMVPKIYRELSTERVLTMERVIGVKPTNIAALREAGHDLPSIARRGAELLLKQIFVHGFFHADPHPGNLFILPTGVIAYVDFGMMGKVSPSEREDFTKALLRIVRRDDKKAVDSLLRLTVFEGEPDRVRLESDLTDGLERYLYRSLAELDLGSLISDVMEILTRHHLSLKPALFLMVKALAAVEGMGRLLDPKFQIVEVAEPFIRRVYARRYSPRRVAGDLMDSGASVARMMRDLPGEVQDTFRLVREGKVKIQFEHHGLKELRSSNERIANRIAFAIVLASLIVGSSLIALSGIPPKWGEVPLIGLGGFLVAGIMGFWLLVSILRGGQGKM